MIGEHAVYAHGSDEWETPNELFDRLDAEFHFTLDACATSENRKCSAYFNKTDDGLSRNWGGRSSGATHRIARSASGCRRVIKKQ